MLESIGIVGWCWPGTATYPDYVMPAVRDWWAKLFTSSASIRMEALSNANMYTWNDMNEPSVFNGPELSMHRDNLHRSGGGETGLQVKWWEHREVHNIVGMYVQMSSHNGQLLRTNNAERTFVLSRSFFAGSQRFGLIFLLSDPNLSLLIIII